jgi:acetyl-CoA synthetase
LQNGKCFAGKEYQRRSSLYLFTNDPGISCFHLACARIGAIHSVVFAGFSAAVASRIIDSECKMVTSDGGYRGNKTIALKEIIDEALKNAHR